MQLIIPLEYVMSCSDEGLQNIEMKRLAEARNLEKEAQEIFREAQIKRDSANVIRWFIENRGELLRMAASHLDSQCGTDWGGKNDLGDGVAHRPAPERGVEGDMSDAA